MKVIFAISVSFLASVAFAQKQVQVNLGTGAAKTVQGSVKGKAYVDYMVKAGAGQSLAVTLKPSSTSAYFNLLPPKSTGAALYNGSMGGNKMANRRLPSDGRYTIRIYLMGAAADEGKTVSYRLTVLLSGRAIAAKTGGGDVKIPGTPYHARGPVDCKIALDKARTQCDASVIRRVGNGNATVDLKAGRLVRSVLFVAGKPAASDSYEAFSFERKGDMTIIRFGDEPSEEYSIPDALIFGG